MSLALVITIVVIALVFDFLNGFHDAANSIATVVATKVLTPFKAVLWAAFFNLVAPLCFGVAVADTVAKTVNAEAFKDPKELVMILFAGLCGAIIWNILTWYFALPTSSSHALIGGLAGAGLTAAYILNGSMAGVLNWKNIDKTAMFIVLSPLIGMIAGFLIMLIVMHMFRRATPNKIDVWFRRLQLVSAAAYSWGHGTNDAQKTMGVIALVLVTSGHLAPGPIEANITVYSTPASVECKATKDFLKQKKIKFTEVNVASSALGKSKMIELSHQSNVPVIDVAGTVIKGFDRKKLDDETEKHRKLPVPVWIKLLCAAAIAVGTMSGGWRIVKTMGLGITKLKPVGGFCAETGGALAIIGATMAGIPVSTTHTITGAIVGVGATNRLSAVRWGIAGRIVWAWILTMPLAALVSSGTYLIIHYLTP